MKALFWVCTGLMVLISLIIIWPGFKDGRIKAWVSILFALFTFIAYLHWGSPDGIQAYYRPGQKNKRVRQQALRPLLAEFHKTEQRYLLRVEQNPTDREAWSNLGQIYLIQGKKTEAEAAFNEAKNRDY